MASVNRHWRTRRWRRTFRCCRLRSHINVSVCCWPFKSSVEFVFSVSIVIRLSQYPDRSKLPVRTFSFSGPPFFFRDIWRATCRGKWFTTNYLCVCMCVCDRVVARWQILVPKGNRWWLAGSKALQPQLLRRLVRIRLVTTRSWVVNHRRLTSLPPIPPSRSLSPILMRSLKVRYSSCCVFQLSNVISKRSNYRSKGETLTGPPSKPWQSSLYSRNFKQARLFITTTNTVHLLKAAYVIKVDWNWLSSQYEILKVLNS